MKIRKAEAPSNFTLSFFRLCWTLFYCGRWHLLQRLLQAAASAERASDAELLQ